ncbi:hypothetical protein TWF788_009153 [Orbilia oligospora]|uniref:Aminoglycoside phosphotransferase domain-containing protein n=1 Tax=Orbilia oligospora TaxID=2813651 RepID=A0A7C8PI94_ORBOL|nr:hypothetical protein TWF788_009153 [Orbilia oligospora]
MNPYEADPAKIPADDPYADVPLYDSSTLLYEDPNDDARDVFAFGSIIVKSSHLKSTLPMRQYSLSDENELAATKVVRGALNRMGIEVPEILFTGKARKVLGQFRNISSNSSSSLPSYLVPDNDPVKHRNITEEEKSILFGKNKDRDFDGKAIREEERSEDFCLMHNDLGTSNIIVNHDKIVGIIDWEMAGFFGLKRACAVHQQCRTPKREDFANLNLEEEHLADLTSWYDLYQLD